MSFWLLLWVVVTGRVPHDEKIIVIFYVFIVVRDMCKTRSCYFFLPVDDGRASHETKVHYTNYTDPAVFFHHYFTLLL